MKQTYRILSTVGLAVICRVSPEATGQVVTNGGFESGDLAGWQVRGDGDVRPSYPTEPAGNQWALLGETPGVVAGGVSQIWQSVVLPVGGDHLSFSYRFEYGGSVAPPVLLGAVSRKYHSAPGPGNVDIDVTAETECRAAGSIPAGGQTGLTLEVTFDRPIALLGMFGGNVGLDVGTVSSLSVLNETLEITIVDVPYVAELNLTFPGVTDARQRRPDLTSHATLCVAVAVGDYNNDGRVNQADIDAVANAGLLDTNTTVNTARADWNLDGLVNAQDADDIGPAGADLVGGPFVDCPTYIPGGTPIDLVDPALPPDGFAALLIKDDGSPDRLDGLNPSTPSPAFSTAFFYHDSNGEILYDPNWVVANADPDENNMYGVDLDLLPLNLQADTPARIVFALAAASAEGKHADSIVKLDDVRVGCPNSMCCPPVGTPTPRLDDDPCTVDTCGADGIPVHTLMSPCCEKCNESAGDVVIMLDVTGSVSISGVQHEKEAAKELLTFFGSSPVRPRVTIGVFGRALSDPTAFAEIVNDQPLTSAYGQDGPAATGLYALIDGIRSFGEGGTDVSEAITTAQAALPLLESPNYIILVSDGIPTLPMMNCLNPPPDCVCGRAKDAAREAKQAAEDAGTNIATVHYRDPGLTGCANEPANGRAFLTEMATHPDLYFQGDWPDLACTFHGITTKIGCDDDNPDTPDCCVSGQCFHGEPNCPGLPILNVVSPPQVVYDHRPEASLEAGREENRGQRQPWVETPE